MGDADIDELPMTVPVLRTCKIAEVLQGAGFQANQAQAVASLIKRSRELDRGCVTGEGATTRVDGFEWDIAAHLDLMVRRMTIRLGLMMVIAYGLVIAAIKFL